MTVTDLVMNFRTALFGLIPSIERVGIPWKRPDAYDEWDDIATAIYKALVVEPLRSSLPKSKRDEFSLPDYDLILPSYLGMSVIGILPERTGEPVKVFHALGTESKPFDVVEWRAVNSNGLPESELIETTPLKNTNFILKIHNNGFVNYHIDKIKDLC